MRTYSIPVRVLAAALIAVTASACGDGGDEKPAPASAAEQLPATPTTEGPAETATEVATTLGVPAVLPDGREITVTVERLPVFTGSREETPDGKVNTVHLEGGAVPVRVRISLTNKGASPADLSQMFVRDMVGTTSGGEAVKTIWSTVEEQPLKGLVAPGATGSGADDYAVPPAVAGGFRIRLAMQMGLVEVGAVPDVVVTGVLPAVSG